MVRLLIFLVLLVASPLLRAQSDNHVIIITIDGFPAYMLDDPQASIPTLRKLAREGTTAEGLLVSNPAVTWPNHTTLITGAPPRKHSVLFNGRLIRGEPGKPVFIDGKRDQSELAAIPTLFDILAGKGLRSAAINWPCTRNAPHLEDNFPDVPEQITHTTPRLRQELAAAGVLPDETQKSFQSLSAASRDQIWTEAACHVIRQRKPHFILVHMLITDGTHHKYGAQSQASYTAVTLADAQMREILRALDDAGIRDKTTLFIVADHGFETADKLLNPNVLLRKNGLLQAASTANIQTARAQSISEGGIAMVYLTNPATQAEDARKVRELFAHAEGIAEVIGPDQFESLGLPDPDKNPQMANLILAAKRGYAFSNDAHGQDFVTPIVQGIHNLGYHGFLASNPKMNALFIASGHRIKAGQKIGLVTNTDIAPTAAVLLGAELPEAEGKPLLSILNN